MIEEKWHFFVLGDKGRLSEKPSLARQGKDEDPSKREVHQLNNEGNHWKD